MSVLFITRGKRARLLGIAQPWGKDSTIIAARYSVCKCVGTSFAERNRPMTKFSLQREFHKKAIIARRYDEAILNLHKQLIHHFQT